MVLLRPTQMRLVSYYAKQLTNVGSLLLMQREKDVGWKGLIKEKCSKIISFLVKSTAMKKVGKNSQLIYKILHFSKYRKSYQNMIKVKQWNS